MTAAPSTRTLVLISASLYTGFCSLPFLHPALRNVLGEAADVAQMSAYFWPYPLFLSLLKSLEGSTATWIVVDLLGLGVVVLVSAYAFRKLRGLGVKQWFLYAVALVLWYLPLLGVQLVAFAIAFILGMDIGE